jgi:hypothetical protein
MISTRSMVIFISSKKVQKPTGTNPNPANSPKAPKELPEANPKKPREKHYHRVGKAAPFGYDKSYSKETLSTGTLRYLP